MSSSEDEAGLISLSSSSEDEAGMSFMSVNEDEMTEDNQQDLCSLPKLDSTLSSTDEGGISLDSSSEELYLDDTDTHEKDIEFVNAKLPPPRNFNSYIFCKFFFYFYASLKEGGG